MIGDAQDLVRQAIEELYDFGIACDINKAALMVRHLELVVERNQTVNLTRITNPKEAVTLHITDSLLPLGCEEVHVDSNSCFIDIGCGAGFPGIPIAITTGASGVLVDSVGKKAAAAAGFVEELGLDGVRVLHTRIEEVPAKVLGRQDLAVARAVAEARVLVEYGAPLLKFGGLLALEKGCPSKEEVDEARKTAEVCGMRFVKKHTFELPRGLGHREVILFEKVGEPLVALPRRAGLAKKRPLR